MQRYLDLSRIGASALAVGTCQAVLDYVIPYCNEREAFGEPITNRQSVAFMIADMAIETESMRLILGQIFEHAHRPLGCLQVLQVDQRDQFIGAGVGARRVDQPRGEPHGVLVHRLHHFGVGLFDVAALAGDQQNVAGLKADIGQAGTDAACQCHLDEDQRFVWQRGVEEAETTPVFSKTAAQVIPTADRVDRFVTHDFFQQLGRTTPVDPLQTQKPAVEPRSQQVSEIGVDAA